MSTLPQLYPDNSHLLMSRTITVRDNVVHDITSDNGTAKGIEIIWTRDARIKRNRMYKIDNRQGNSYGMTVEGCADALLVLNAASRSQNGFSFASITTLNVYNLTTHNCFYGIVSASPGTYRNIAMSVNFNTRFYKQAVGFSLGGLVDADVDYLYYFNLGQLAFGGNVILGGTVLEKEILYMDEENNDLTPDHISELVLSGTTNPFNTSTPDIGGVESEVIDETTAKRKYFYELLDNSFWYIEFDKAVEVSFIKAFQSRILANSELANSEVERNMYLKVANGVSRFTELYPMYARYCDGEHFKRRVMDLWYAGQNCGTVQAYQNAIGGYNLLPSFLKRLLDVDDSWIIGESYINYNNHLLGTAEQQFGIGIDILGLSTLTTSTSAECYRNVMNSVADIGPVEWFLHDEVEPTNYVVFTDMYHGFNNCTLTNMVYSDRYTIMPLEVETATQLVTPGIQLPGTTTLTPGSSGVVNPSREFEYSLLDRIYSENIDRTIQCRVGDHTSSMGSWVSLTRAVGGTFTTDKVYVQFKLAIAGILRQIDYDFMGIALRYYTSSRNWTP